jgi:hypothetical protein
LLNTPYPQSFEMDMTLSSAETFVPDYSKVSQVELAASSAYVQN